jgi:hypothetical protein
MTTMRALALLLLGVGVSAQGNMLTDCTKGAIQVNARCCHNTLCSGGVPRACPSQQCASTYLPFYRRCGSVLQAVEHQFPNSAKFATLYHSCVQKAGHVSATTGKIVDAGVQATTLFDFRKPAAPVNWRVTVDGVMGGHSQGTVSKSSNGVCQGMLMQGTIELTHGGFVVAYSPDVSSSLAKADGIRICSKATKDYGIKDNLVSQASAKVSTFCMNAKIG